jgi:hypothetical protein
MGDRQERSLGCALRFRPTYAPRQAGAGWGEQGHPSDSLPPCLIPTKGRPTTASMKCS